MRLFKGLGKDDFAIVNCATKIERKDGIISAARICLNGVFNVPYRVIEAEEKVKGRAMDEAVAVEAGNAAVTGVCPLKNGYKIQIAKTLVTRTLLGCA